MIKKVNIVYYVDTDDNTKGAICAIPSDKDMRSLDILDEVAKHIEESGILCQYYMYAYDIAKAVTHHGFSNFAEYQFGVEETELID